jgi:hypothetical protein
MVHAAFRDQRKIDLKCFVISILASAAAADLMSESLFGNVHGTMCIGQIFEWSYRYPTPKVTSGG